MDKQLQQRLLGAAVIVALVVIFVPELVKSPVDQEPESASPIPGELPALPERPVATAQDGLLITLPPPQQLSDEPFSPEQLAAMEPIESLPAEPVPAESPPIEPEAMLESAAPEPIAEPEDAFPIQQEPVAAEPPPAARAVEPTPRTTPPPAQRPEPAPPTRTARVEPPVPAVEPVLPELRLISRPMEQYQAQTQAEQPRWVVQAGSFEAAENAHQLRDQLRARQFPATLTQATVDGRVLYRVQIGPHSSRSEGERVRDRLRHETGIDGSLIPVYN